MLYMFEWMRQWRLGNEYGYEKYFRNQDLRPEGKPGIILADLGMPEDYDSRFYTSFMNHVFNYALPLFLQRFIMADRGIALIDPANPLAREPFTPSRLSDMHGSFNNRAGRPYVDCDFTWRPPGMKRNPSDHGYFLYKGDGRGGAPDICQKTAAKVAGWYYGYLLPEKKISWQHQCGQIYKDSTASLKRIFPEAEFRHARYVCEDSVHQAVEELLEAGCKTIVYQCFSNPVYSDFEDYAYALPMVHRSVKGRAKVICADQPGNQPALREAFIQLTCDALSDLPSDASVLLILSKHGHPFRKETLDKRGPEYRVPLEEGMRNLMQKRNGRCELVWSDDEYADEYWDPGNTKLSTFMAYRKAIDEGYDYAVEVPTDFIAENTDLMILHAMKKFAAFKEYDPFTPIHYPDWEKPLVRVFHENKTTGIYIGCPVGKYRRYIVEATINSISDVLNRY